MTGCFGKTARCINDLGPRQIFACLCYIFQLLRARFTRQAICKVTDIFCHSPLPRWYLLSLAAGAIILGLTYAKQLIPAENDLPHAVVAILILLPGLLPSCVLFVEHHRERGHGFCSVVCPLPWVLLLICKVTSLDDKEFLFGCSPKFVRQMCWIVIISNIFLHLPNRIWVKVPWIKWSQLPKSAQACCLMLLYIYMQWVVGLDLCPHEKSALPCTILLLCSASGTTISIYLQFSHFHLQGEDEKSIPFVGTFVSKVLKAACNTGLSMLWIWTTIMQAQAGAVLLTLPCIVFAIIHITMTLRVWWHEYSSFDTWIDFSRPEDIIMEPVLYAKHLWIYITSRPKYEHYMHVQWFTNFFLFAVVLCTNGTVGLRCEWNRYVPECICGNILAGIGMIVSQIITLHPHFLAIGPTWRVPQENHNVRSKVWENSVVVCSFLRLVGWILIITTGRKARCHGHWRNWTSACIGNVTVILVLPVFLEIFIDALHIYHFLQRNRKRI